MGFSSFDRGGESPEDKEKVDKMEADLQIVEDILEDLLKEFPADSVQWRAIESARDQVDYGMRSMLEGLTTLTYAIGGVAKTPEDNQKYATTVSHTLLKVIKDAHDSFLGSITEAGSSDREFSRVTGAIMAAIETASSLEEAQRLVSAHLETMDIPDEMKERTLGALDDGIDRLRREKLDRAKTPDALSALADALRDANGGEFPVTMEDMIAAADNLEMPGGADLDDEGPGGIDLDDVPRVV